MFYATDVPFKDWKATFHQHTKLVYVDEMPNLEKGTEAESDRILPLTMDNYIRFNEHPRCIFKNNLGNIDILHNKSKFAEYMMRMFIENIPPVYYYNYENITYRHPSVNALNEKMIQKPNTCFGGKRIKIVHAIPRALKNIIVSKYIEHTQYFCGHFLVVNGTICKKLYFSILKKNTKDIQKGPVENYTIHDELEVDDTIFQKIFSNLSYSGFACADFIIHENTILIFEINPRPGGSLVRNVEQFGAFLDHLRNRVF